MEIIMKILSVICEAIPIAIVLLIFIYGIAKKIKNFLVLDAENKKKVLQEQANKALELVKPQLLSIVTQAEKEWGGGTGKIKKSWVWEQLATQYKSIIQYIEEGFISKDTVDLLIELAVTDLDKLRETNDSVEAIVSINK